MPSWPVGRRSSSRQAPVPAAMAASGPAVIPRRWMWSSRPGPIAGARTAIPAEAVRGQLIHQPAGDRLSSAIPARRQISTAIPPRCVLLPLEPHPGWPSLRARRSASSRAWLRAAQTTCASRAASRRRSGTYNALASPPNLHEQAPHEERHRTTSEVWPGDTAGYQLSAVSSAQVKVWHRELTAVSRRFADREKRHGVSAGRRHRVSVSGRRVARHVRPGGWFDGCSAMAFMSPAATSGSLVPATSVR